MADVNDLTDSYMESAASAHRTRDVAEMEEFVRGATMETGGGFTEAQPPVRLKEGQKLPELPPPRRPTEDKLGRLPGTEESVGGAIMRNVAEIPGAAAAGIDSAVHNALSFMDPLANWLDENVADTRYTPYAPHTMTGEITKSASEFFTGFIPALKGLRAMGMASNITGPMVAGALSDFAVRNPQEGRLSDLWKKLELPDNILTDYLESKPDDTQMESRFKNALEGAGLGVLTEGVLLGARALRAARAIPGAKQAEEEFLKIKYGEVTDKEYARVVGDESLPLVSAPPKSVKPLAGMLEKEFGGVEKATVALRIGNKVYEALPGETTHGQIMNRLVKESPEVIAPVGKTSTLKVEDGWVRGNKFLDREQAMRELGYNDTQFIDASALNKTFGGAEKAAEWAEKRAVAMESSGFPEKANQYRLVAKELKGGKLTAAEKKIAAAAEGLPDFDPRALIRGKRGEMLPEDFQMYVNFSRIDEPDKVKFVIGKMAEAMKGNIDEARRGIITQQETKNLADKLGMSVEDLLSRRRGAPLNAEEAVAARSLWAASGDKLLELAKMAAGPNAGAIDQFAFRRQMAVHAAIQNEVIGARTETARALNAWKISTGEETLGSMARARAIDMIMSAHGGTSTSQEMARRIAILADLGTPELSGLIGRMVTKGYGASTVDAIKELWIQGLLSNPKTHVVNVTSNTLVAFQQIYERAAASGIRSITGGEGVVPGEAMAMAFGLVQSYKEAFRLSAKALRTGETTMGFGKIDLPRQNALSAEAFRMSRETGAGRFVDFLGHATNVPGRLLGAEDEFFKTIGYRMELNAQALRTASQEGKQGKELAMRVQEIVNNPPEYIKINSADAAMYNTFTNQMGWFGQNVMKLRNYDSPMNATMLVFPFVRTPVNIARYAFERTPLAPFVGQWRADIAAGGARADLALARMATGTAVMLATMDYADSGLISGKGPSDPGQRQAMERQGWRPWSMNVDGRWHSFNRLDPIGMTMGLAASIAEAVKHGEVSQDDVDEWHEVAAMAIAAISQVTISKTYLEGVSRLVEVMSEPKRYTERYVDDLVASFLPMTSLMSGIKNMVDPISREVNSPMDAVMARIAGLSDRLTPRRDLWGKPLTTASGLGRVYDFVSPVASSAEVDSPIDKEIVRLDAGPERIGKHTTFQGINVNLKGFPQVYDEYVRLAGNDLKNPAWGMGAKDYLDSVITGKSPMSPVYKIMGDEARKAFIQSTISEYRRLAQEKIMADPKFRGFTDEVRRLQKITELNKMPVLSGE